MHDVHYLFRKPLHQARGRRLRSSMMVLHMGEEMERYWCRSSLARSSANTDTGHTKAWSGIAPWKVRCRVPNENDRVSENDRIGCAVQGRACP